MTLIELRVKEKRIIEVGNREGINNQPILSNSVSSPLVFFKKDKDD